MASYNLCVLMGNLASDPQVKYLTNGTAVCDFSIAVNEKYKNKEGQNVENVNFFEVTFFGKVAEVCGEYLAKGKMIQVSGKLKQDSWDDKDTGQKRSKVKVIGESMQMLGGKPGAGANGGSQSEQSSNSGSQSFDNPPQTDEVPF